MEMLAASDCMHFIDLPALTEILGLRLAGLGGIIGRADKPNRMSWKPVFECGWQAIHPAAHLAEIST